MKKFSLFLLLIISQLSVMAQVDLYNKNVIVSGGDQVLIYIPGSLIEASTGNFEDDVRFKSQGNLHIRGDINNLGSTAVFDYDTVLTINFIGNLVQNIIGNTSIVLGEVVVDKGANRVLLNRETQINKKLTFRNGVFDVNDSRLVFNGLFDGAGVTDIDLIIDENDARYITGNDGHLVYRTDGIVENTTFANYSNFGMGFTNAAGLSAFEIRRYFKTGYSVANGINIDRSFLTQKTAPDSLSNINFRYLTHELNGLDESNLAVYYSIDDGISWIKLSGTTNEAQNIINTTDDVLIPANQAALFTIADDICLPANRPTSTFSANHAIVNDSINICFGADLEISELTRNDDYFYEWSSPVLSSPITSDVLTVSNIEFANEGWYTLYVRNENGCETINRVYVNVRDIPVPAFSTTRNTLLTNVCFGESLSFQDESNTAVMEGIIAEYRWDFNDGGATSNERNPIHEYSVAGKFNPTLEIVSEFNCVSEVKATKLVEIQTLPTVTFNIKDTDGNIISESCEREDLTFENNSSYIDINAAVESDFINSWSFPDGTGSVDKNPVYDFPNASNGLVKLIVESSTTGCKDSTTRNLTIFEKPDGQFKTQVMEIDSSAVCEGTFINFINQTSITDGSAITYVWDFGDMTATVTDENTRHVYSAPGDYVVTLTSTSVDHPMCVDVVTETIRVDPSPKAGFRITDFDQCVDQFFTFTDTTILATGSYNAIWSFGNDVDSVTNVKIIDYQYPFPKRGYDVRLSVTSDKGCPASATQNINANPNPIPNFFALTQCEGDSLIFINGSLGLFEEDLSYDWNFGPLGFSNARDTAFTNVNPGAFDVKLTVTTEYGCVADTTKRVEIAQNPSFDLGGSQISCTGTYTIDPQIGSDVFLPAMSTYEWKNLAGIVQGNDPTLTVTTSDLYRVTVITPDGCLFESAVNVSIFNPIELGTDIVLCEPTTLVAEKNRIQIRNADNTTFQWTKDGMPFASTDTISVSETGLYEVVITRTKNGQSCTDSDQIHVEIQPDPVLDLGPDKEACRGETISFTSNLVATSYKWIDLSNGLTVGTDQTFMITDDGSFDSRSYRLDAEVGLCKVTDTVSISFNNLPNVSFNASKSSICEGESISFTNRTFVETGSLAATPFTWDFGDGSVVSNDTNPTHTYDAFGIYEVTLTAETSKGCTSFFKMNVEVKTPPVADFTIADNCQNENISLTNISISGGSATYFWDFDDGTTSEEENPVKAFSFPRNYNVMLTVTENGCETTTSKTVEIFNIPDLDLGADISTCGSTYEIDPGPIGNSYKWINPLNGMEISTNQSLVVSSDQSVVLEISNANGCTVRDTVAITLNSAVTVSLGNDQTVCESIELDAGFSTNGIYNWSTGETTRRINVVTTGTYSVTVTDQNNCKGSDEIVIDVLNQPTVDLGDDITLCEGEKTNLVISNAQGYDVLWSTLETTNQIEITESGTYSVTVSNGICIAEDEITVIINTNPAIEITSQNVCLGETISFDNEVIADDVSYLWSFGDGTLSGLRNPDKTYQLPGNYEVTLEVTNLITNCITTDQVTVTVSDLPTPNFIVRDVCQGQEVFFENITPNNATLNFSWKFANGETSEVVNGNTIYNVSGDYLVTLTASNAQGCEVSVTKEITIFNKPVVDLFDEEATCDDEVVLNASNAGNRFLWSDNSINQTLRVRRGNGGIYKVTVTNDNGCVSSDSVLVSFNDKVIPDLGDDIDTCDEAVLSAGVEATSYIWSTGEIAQEINVNSSGEYWLQAFSADRCLATDTIQVVVKPLPTIALPNEYETCKGDSILIDATHPTMNVSYLWSTGNTTSGIYIKENGNYSVTLTSEDNCSFTQEFRGIFNELPVIGLPEQISACDSVELSLEERNSEVLWSTGETTNDIVIKESGIYSVTLTNSKGCSVSQEINVTVNPSPQISLGEDIAICEGTSTILSADINFSSSAQLNYLWSTGQTSAEIEVSDEGVYTVLITDVNGCSDTDQVELKIIPNPALDLGDDITRCGIDGQQQDQLILRTGLTGLTHQWGSEAGLTGSLDSLVITEDGRYWVTVINESGCLSTDTIRVSSTNNGILASFLMPTNVEVGDEVHFVQLTEPEPLTFSWDFGNGVTSANMNPTRRFRAAGEYKITLTVSNGACTNSLTKTLIVAEQGSGRLEEEEIEPKAVFLEIITAKLYPNPSPGRVFFDLELNKIAEAKITIYSLSGKMVDRHVIKTDKHLMDMDLSHLPAGLYVLDLELPGRRKRFKFIMNKNSQ